MITATLIALVLAAGCTKDTDCKGERICEEGRCVYPPAPSSNTSQQEVPPTPAVTPVAPDSGAAPTESRSPLGGDEQQDREAPLPPPAWCPEGMVHTSDGCVEKIAPYVPPRWRRRGATSESEDRKPGFVGDLAFMGSLNIITGAAGAVTLPGISLLGQLGGKVSPTFGLTGLATASFIFGPGGSVSVVGFGPGLRFGDEGHFTLSPGYSLVTINTSLGSITGGAFCLNGFGAVPLSGHFALTFLSSLLIDPTGVLLQFGIGLGGSAF
jgi:hypothetical protein